MSPSFSRLPLERSVREALVAALQLKLPPGQPAPLDAIEAATVQLMHEIGLQLMEDVMAGVEPDPKKGALPSAVATRPSSKTSKRGPSRR